MDANLFDLACDLNRSYAEGMKQGKTREVQVLRKIVSCFDRDDMEGLEAAIEEARSLVS